MVACSAQCKVVDSRLVVSLGRLCGCSQAVLRLCGVNEDLRRLRLSCAGLRGFMRGRGGCTRGRQGLGAGLGDGCAWRKCMWQARALESCGLLWVVVDKSRRYLLGTLRFLQLLMLSHGTKAQTRRPSGHTIR